MWKISAAVLHDLLACYLTHRWLQIKLDESSPGALVNRAWSGTEDVG